MKAIVCHEYGSPDVLKLEEINTPVVPEDGVLVRVHASSVNPLDLTMTGKVYFVRLVTGLRKPKRTLLGVDFAGTVEAIGSNVTRFQPGDEVFGVSRGAFAEYVCVPEDRAVVHKPANLTFEQAAAVPVAAVTALQGLRDKGQIQPGQKVLINGASGGVGTFAVQLARAFGAEVTGVCSTSNVDLVRSLGTDHVIDYRHEDFTRSGQRYDLLLDIAGNRSWAEYRRVLKHRGTLVLAGVAGVKGNRWIGPLGHLVTVPLASLGASQKAVFFLAHVNKEDLVALKELLEAGKVMPVIDRRYDLRGVPEALSYLGAGHARGKVAITV
ncbi:MAG: NAD(P)-dependent alcohol dehydrogenase [Chloroflexi bacterium]|nr:NAD(P)-dependent alcohol dehydrogenase [Chloroflexota bacterium]